ncbi:MAG: hypothetical protein P8P29_03285 [Flavobacteriaceae bacterium]|nr:hypothetical protein [Flavobacteriaceae bacterium]
MSKDTVDKAKTKYLLDPKNRKDPDDRKGRKTQYAKPKTISGGMTENYGDKLYKKNAKKAKDRLMDEAKTGKKISKKKPQRISDHDTSRAVWKRNP